jgi:cytochrome b561
MTSANTKQAQTVPRFNLLARCLHWLMAPLLLTMLFIGVCMMTSLQHRIFLINLHRPLGIAILLLAILRLFNRLRHPRVDSGDSLPRWQAAAAHASHLLLYGLMLALPLLGWATLSAGDYPVRMFAGITLPHITPASPVLYAWLRDAHGYLAWLLFAVVLAHVCAALMHAWVLRDKIFSRMT